MLISLIIFHSASKINNDGAGQGCGVVSGRGKKRKISKEIYRTSQNIRMINVSLESLLSESFPSLVVTVHLTSLGCPPALC